MPNALVWITRAEVPRGGVPSRSPTVEDLEENQDEPKGGNWRPEKIREMIDGWNRP